MSERFSISRRGFLCLASLALIGEDAVAGYRQRATRLVQNLPEGAQFRPELEAALLDFANQYRAGFGLAALKPGEVFAAAARAQASDMMQNDFIGHAAGDGTPFERRLRLLGGNIERFGAVGENVTRDTRKTPVDTAKAAALFQQWVNSKPHRANLKNPNYAYAASGVVQRGSAIWAAQIYWGEERKGLIFGSGANATIKP